ncbi:MAG: hypothetical protein WC873_03995 [Candidatus Gracilibacteria bacterium]
MSLEFFGGFDAGEGMSEAAFEAFKEKMAAAAAQIAAIKKEEGKQKKKEDELLKILLQFVKTSQKQELVLLISRALEQELPGGFILNVILLGNPDIQKAVGNFLLLDSSADSNIPNAKPYQAEEKALVFFREDQSLPLKVRIQMDNWMKNMLVQAEEYPQKLLRTAYDVTFPETDTSENFANFDSADSETTSKKPTPVRTIKVILVQLTAFVIRDFLEQNEIFESYERLADFAEFILSGLLERTAENLGERKLLD